MTHRSGRIARVECDYDSLRKHPEVIGEAKGVIMRRYYLSDAESLVRLQRLAREQRARLVDAARGVVREELGV